MTSLDGKAVRRLDFHPGGNAPAVLDQGGYKTKKDALTSVLQQWLQDEQSTERKMLVLWGHSQGVASALSSAGSPLYTSLGRGGFGYSPITGDALTAKDISRAITDAGAGGSGGNNPAIDLLAFDSCFMSTSEAAYELRGKAKYLLASQSAIPLAGFDYTALGNTFAVPPPSDSKDRTVVHVAVELMNQVGQDPDAPRTLALVNLHEEVQEGFRERLQKLTDELLGALGLDPAHPEKEGNRAEWMRIRAAFEQATWHQVRQFVDLADLCRRLLNFCRETPLRQAAMDMVGLLENRSPKLGTTVVNWNEASLVVDTRSAPPWLFGGLSIFCGWLVPTPEEADAGAWNASLHRPHYERQDLFRLGNGEIAPCRWPCLAWDPILLEEGQRNAFYRELDAVRAHLGAMPCTHETNRGFGRHKATWKPPDGGFFSEEHYSRPQPPKDLRSDSNLLSAQSTSAQFFALPPIGLDTSGKR